MPDVFQIVTDRIISKLDQGEIPWRRPWTGVGRYAIKRATGKPYSLLNQLLLGEPGEYLSYTQCHKDGGTIKKGAKSKIVVFWKVLKFPNARDDGNTEDKIIPFLRYMNVFHINDCDGIEPKNYDTTTREFNPIEEAESVIADYIKRSGIKLEHSDQGRSCYTPSRDTVTLPPRERFIGESEYYSTVFHELAHSTGHESRLNRISHDHFGDESYSKEELVAEISSATILSTLGIETESSFQNTAAYIQNWIHALRNDRRMIVSAASRAQKAVEMILNTEMEEEYA